MDGFKEQVKKGFFKCRADIDSLSEEVIKIKNTTSDVIFENSKLKREIIDLKDELKNVYSLITDLKDVLVENKNFEIKTNKQLINLENKNQYLYDEIKLLKEENSKLKENKNNDDFNNSNNYQNDDNNSDNDNSYNNEDDNNRFDDDFKPQNFSNDNDNNSNNNEEKYLSEIQKLRRDLLNEISEVKKIRNQNTQNNQKDQNNNYENYNPNSYGNYNNYNNNNNKYDNLDYQNESFGDDDNYEELVEKKVEKKEKKVIVEEKKITDPYEALLAFKAKSNKKELLKEKLVSMVEKNGINLSELKFLFVDHYNYCSKATFYNYLKEVELEKKISIERSGSKNVVYPKSLVETNSLNKDEVETEKKTQSRFITN